MSWTGTLRRLAGDVLDTASGRGVRADASEQAHLRDVVWKLRLAFEEASDGGALGELVSMVTRDLTNARLALLAWFDLLEDIVQLAEQRFGSASGRGDFKAAEAKAAVSRLLQRPGTRSAVFVDLLGPDTIDLVTGWCIDVIVELLNSNESLWQTSEVTVRVPLRTRILTRLVRWLSSVLAWFSPNPPLDPQLYGEVERIAQGPGSPLVIADEVLALVDWLLHNRQQALALITLVSTACDEVEYFTSLRGSAAKSRYARNLIVATLEDSGLALSGAALEVEEWAISFSIDFVVATNNKRGKYEHARS